MTMRLIPRFYLLLTVTVAAVAAAGVCFALGNWRIGVPAAMAAIFLAGCIVADRRKTIDSFSSFADALEADDSTLQFSAPDRDMEALTGKMNRLIEKNCAHNTELETRKLYYDRILSVMTHEMRNGITPVVSLSDDMAAHPDRYTGGDLADAVALIGSQSKNIKRFLEDYSRLTHLPEIQPQPTDAAGFAASVRRVMEAELQQRGLPDDTIIYNVSAGLTFDIDADLVRQAIVNLLRNSLDATAGTGRKPSVELRITSSDGRPCIFVRDNGSGIAPAIAADLFQSFVTTKPDGSGIGLYLSRQIARRHGGDLRLSSGSGGTTVMMTL